MISESGGAELAAYSEMAVQAWWSSRPAGMECVIAGQQAFLGWLEGASWLEGRWMKSKVLFL